MSQPPDPPEDFSHNDTSKPRLWNVESRIEVESLGGFF